MQPNRVKKILREGGLALGTYVGGIADAQIVEIIGHAGYDAAFIDMEHTSFDLRDVQLMVMAAEHAVVEHEVDPRPRRERGQLLEQLQGLEHERARTIRPCRLEREHDAAGACA